MTLVDCIEYCLGQPELLIQFDRLRGTHLSRMGGRSPLDAAIDEVSGRDEEAMQLFIAFVADAIYPFVASPAQD
jgi:hypothetical protein